jgi:urease accessory protein
LGFEDRFRRRVRLFDDEGHAFWLDLDHATRFEDGDGLALEGGGVILVRAAIEDVLEIVGEDIQHTARLAWHIGNRHTPVEVLKNGHLRIQYDHVLEHMLVGLGAVASRTRSKFSPESGAYDSQSQGETAHGHAHSHHG